MKRTWFLIASSIPDKNEVFFECYDWEVPGKKAYNHTITKNAKGKVDDFPKWNVKIDKNGRFKQQPTMTSYRIGMPFVIESKILSFPENDRHDQFWSLIQKLPDGKWLLFMFALTPHIDQAAYDNQLEKFRTFHGMDLEKLYPLTRIEWKPDYVVGSMGEEFVNLKPVEQ